MGYSPHEDLIDVQGNKYHLEKKSGDRLVLWDEHETRIVLELTMESWLVLADQLDWMPDV